VEMVKNKRVVAADGKVADLGEVDTICVHGDNLKTVALVKSLRKGLEAEGISVVAVGNLV